MPSERPARVPGLSPSRAKDYMQCPLLYRFRVVDRLPEPPSPAAVRGTLVHAVLERLFDLPRPDRTSDAAVGLLPAAWADLVAAEPSCGEVLAEMTSLDAWFEEAAGLLRTYFTLEDPTRLEPSDREMAVAVQLEDGPQLRGIVDRLDVAPNGALRIVDYKTGRSPRAGFEADALFQMRFYALVLSRMLGRMPAMLQLVYLKDGTVLRHEPTEAELRVTEQRVRAVWDSIRRSAESGTWESRPSRLCDWCSHQALCPSFGGTPPPVPEGAVGRALGMRGPAGSQQVEDLAACDSPDLSQADLLE